MASFLSRGSSQKKSKGKGKARNCAGIALHGDSARYVELSGTVGALQVVKQQVAPIARGAIVKDSLVDLEGVVSALEALKSAVGGFRCPVALGIPSRDVILRLIEYPKMSVEEVGEALQFEFDKYFPYPYQEAAADIAEVEVPSHDAADKTIVLVATSKQRVVHDMMRMASKAGISLSAVEPLNVAFFRAAIGPFGRQGGYFVVFVEPETTQIVLGYKDNGILFRSAAVDLTSKEVRESDEGILPILRDPVHRRAHEERGLLAGGEAQFHV